MTDNLQIAIEAMSRGVAELRAERDALQIEVTQLRAERDFYARKADMIGVALRAVEASAAKVSPPRLGTMQNKIALLESNGHV
jgi:uncharacterized coiled-coil DUF342 family protein